jgi:hypothetical protein
MLRVAFAFTLIASGAASRYDPGVFELVEHNRGLPEWDGAHVALLDCSRVGDVVLLCYSGNCVDARVTDCAGVADGGADWMIHGGYAAELDYETALSMDAVGKQVQIYEKNLVPILRYTFD